MLVGRSNDDDRSVPSIWAMVPYDISVPGGDHYRKAEVVLRKGV